MKNSAGFKNIIVKYRFLIIALSVVLLTAAAVVPTVLLVADHDAELTKIEIVSAPNKTQYIENQRLELEGLIVKAHFGNKSADVSDYSVDKTVLKKGDTSVTVSYTSEGITKTAEFPITVAERSVERIEIVNPPSRLDYLENTPFDPTGMTVRAYYDNGEAEFASGWEYDNRPLTIADEFVTIVFGGKTAVVPVSVNPKLLTAITASGFPHKIAYVEGEYFDFLGAEIYAHYSNAPTEPISGWDYDKKEPLAVSDTEVTIFYELHGVKKTIVVPITVAAAPIIDTERELADEVVKLLPPVEEMTADNLGTLEYALTVLKGIENPAPEHIEKIAELEAKRGEIIANMPPVPEPEYKLRYEMANGLIFSDVNYGGNPAVYKNSGGEVLLKPAESSEASALGYEFKGWIIGGQAADRIVGLSADTTIYALFELTERADLVFTDSSTGAVLYRMASVKRTADFDFDSTGAAAAIYAACGKLPIAYYQGDRRVESADMSLGAAVKLSVVTTDAREMHLKDGSSATVSWRYAFNGINGAEIAEMPPETGTVFVIPIDAEVVITALNANISEILLDGVRVGERLNNTVVEARLTLMAGEYPAAVTFNTVISDATTLSFIGQGQHSVVYPSGWDGHIAAVDLERIAFFFDEANDSYIALYIIEGKSYYFDDLAGYRFTGDTEIRVKRIRNSFALTVYYIGGSEKIEGLKGRQSLRAALSELGAEATAKINAILGGGALYTDAAMSAPVTADEALNAELLGNVMLFSDWKEPIPPPPTPPDFGPADYTGLGHIGAWRGMLEHEGAVVSSELTLTADGLYSYKTFVNGALSAEVGGIYRLESGRIILKTFELNYEYQIVSADDLLIDIKFAGDGILRASVIILSGTSKTTFEHTMIKGNIRTVNYTGMDFVGRHEYNGAVIELKANGTAAIERGGAVYNVYYRVDEDMRLYIYDNGAIGTGEIAGLIGGNHEITQ